MTKSTFSNFTNLYSLSKTLRFELKPIPETQELLKKTNINGKTPVQVDQEIDELYHKVMKPLLDELHELFISNTLESINFNLQDLHTLEKLYLELRTLSKDRKNNLDRLETLQGREGEISKAQHNLRRFICEQFAIEAEKWKDKYSGIKLDDKGYKILTNAKILEVLLILHPEKSESIKKFQSFFTYFSGFNQNRENYYTEEAKATGVANRIINENFVVFINDKQIFEQIAQRIPNLDDYKKYFELDNYQNCLSQEAIENFNENIVGKINFEKNLYLQQENSKPENKDKKIYLPNLKKLYKQIGCQTKQQKELEDQSSSSYPQYLEKNGLGFQIKKDNEWKYEIWQTIQYLNNTYEEKLIKLKQNYQNFFENWNEYNLHEIWFRKVSINTISSRWFGGYNWNILTNALSKTGTGKVEKGEYKIPQIVSLNELKQAMDELKMYNAENLFKEEYEHYYKSTLFETFLSIWQYEVASKFAEIQKYQNAFEDKSKVSFDKNMKDENGKSVHTEVVKNLIEEGYLRFYQLTKYHNLEKKGEKDPRPTEGKFYDELEKFWEGNDIVTYHKALQATLTKKPYSENKTKLNFENGSLLGGFSDGQEKNKAGVILINKDKYYIGILLNRGFFRTDKQNPLYETNDKNWQRLILTNLKFQTLAGKGFLGKYGISYGEMGKEDPLKAVQLLQGFISDHYLHKYPQLSPVTGKTYKYKKDFDAEIKEVLRDCFTMKFVPIKKDILDQGLKHEYLYLFEITNKDFSEFSKSKNKNIHTYYWQQLFHDENLHKPILALNGGAEIFFRKGQKEKLLTRIDKSGKEVLSNKRFSTDKYFLHASITINYGKPKNIKYKDLINQKIKNNTNDMNIIGIDRGEKHLLYYSVINLKGEILESGSLNTINGVDYNAKLQEKQTMRNKARLDWEVIGKIKDLKEGYLSQAVYKIYELIIKYNAIVVLENLNTEFKAKRMAKVEKSVYKKFELALARKLNHLILKDKDPNELGGVLNAYQLTPAISAGDVGKFEKAPQWGIMYYVRANYTSTTDPLTGWRKHKYISNSETDKKIKDFFNPDTGVQINFDMKNNCFKFSYDHEGTTWQLFAYKGLERFYWNNKERKMEVCNVYEEFGKLFTGLHTSENINQQIIEKDINWKRLAFLWNMLNQIRNTDREKLGNKNDFLQSPIWSDKYKQFYDSRKENGFDRPDNGDANGAYNIARKGVILMRRINTCSEISKFGNDKGRNPENGYYISDIDWDTAVSNWDEFVK